MSVERKRGIRREILFQLYAVRPLALSPGVLMRQSREAAIRMDEGEAKAEAEFLVGQGLAERVQDAATGAIRYAITSAGAIEYENS